MTKKMSRKEKLELLKSLKKTQEQSQKLASEQSINIIQTKLLEKELQDMKEHLKMLEQKKSRLQVQQESQDERA